MLLLAYPLKIKMYLTGTNVPYRYIKRTRTVMRVLFLWFHFCSSFRSYDCLAAASSTAMRMAAGRGMVTASAAMSSAASTS